MKGWSPCKREALSAGAVSCTSDEFNSAVTSAGFPAPTSAQYNGFNGHTANGGFSTKRELAMFLAEILWESGGLKYKSEISPPAGAYVTPQVHNID